MENEPNNEKINVGGIAILVIVVIAFAAIASYGGSKISSSSSSSSTSSSSFSNTYKSDSQYKKDVDSISRDFNVSPKEVDAKIDAMTKYLNSK